MKLDGEKGVIHHFLLDCEVRGRSKLTVVSYGYRLGFMVRLLEMLCGISELEQVTVLHLRQCVQYMLNTGTLPPRNEKYQGRKPLNGKSLDAITVQAYVRVWKAFFNWCYQEELINSNPAARLHPPKSVERIVSTFTVEHIEKMLSTCDLKTDLGFRNYVILLLLLDTGMRLSEICGLHVNDVHDRYVKVFGKGRKEREIGIRPEVGKLLWKYVHKHRHPSDPGETALFIGNGKPLGVGGLKQVIGAIKRQSGIEGVRVSAHTFRHTFAKMYLEQGGEVFKLSREMGHSDMKITEVYLRDFSSTEARREHDAFSPVARLQLKNQRKRSKQQE